MRLSLHQKNAMKFLQIALMRMNVSERLNLYDPFFTASPVLRSDMPRRSSHRIYRSEPWDTVVFYPSA